MKGDRRKIDICLVQNKGGKGIILNGFVFDSMRYGRFKMIYKCWSWGEYGD